MNKAVKHTYGGMNQDINKSGFPNNLYFEGRNIRITATDTQSTGSVTNEKGNTLIVTIPKPIINPLTTSIDYTVLNGITKKLVYSTSNISQPRSEIEQQYYISNNNYRTSGDQIIIGHALVRDAFILFTTDNNGFDCIWKVNDITYDLTLLYLRDLNFSTSNPIQAIGNFENDIIDKVYWVDGKEQLRFINTLHSIENGDLENLIDLPYDTINSVSSFDLTQPIIQDIVSGGSHTAGKIQYAYNLFRLNNSQTKLSPLSELVSLTKGDNLGGGEVNEIVGAVPIININDIDTTYTHIRIYAIKYTSYNNQPSISLIHEREINENTSLSYYDDGSIIQSISLDEFLFLGSDIIIPKHIATKKNIMFMANYKEKDFDLDLDCRAYSFNIGGNSTIYNNIRLNESGTIIGDFINVPNNYNIPENFDSINLYYDIYKYQKDGSTLGGEGKFLKYQLAKTIENNNNRFFKDDEVYRIAIQFYNRRGQTSLPKWINDFKAPSGNLEGQYNILNVTLKPEFYIWLNTSSNFESEDDKPVGYRLLRADRQLKDRTIVSSGLLSTMMVNDKLGQGHNNYEYKKERAKVIPKLPNILVRTFENVLPLRAYENLAQMDIDSGLGNNYQTEVAYNGGAVITNTFQYNTMLQMYSPETMFYDGVSFSNNLELSVKGGLKNFYNAYWGQEKSVAAGGGVITEGKVFNGLSPFYVAPDSKLTIKGNVNNLLDEGFIAHPGGSDPNVVAWDQYYRVFGKNLNNINIPISNNSQIIFTNDFDPKPDVPTDNVNIRFFPPNQRNVVRIDLNPDRNPEAGQSYRATINYTITPAVGFETTPYNAYIRLVPSDANVAVLLNTTGVNTISKDFRFNVTTFSPVFITTNFSVELVIEPLDGNLSGNVDITVNSEIREGVGFPIIKSTFDTESINNDFILTYTPPGTIIEGGFIPSPNKVRSEIYGIPELTERGADFKAYNNDSVYTYSNSLQSFLSNGNDDYDDGGTSGRAIVSINSFGAKTVTMVLGPDTQNIEHWQRPNIENLYQVSGIPDTDVALYGELVKSRNDIYLGNIYGGNTYEDKQRTNYLEIGDYYEIEESSITINSPGDTYIGNFRFERINKTSQDILDQTVQQFTEIVEFTVETTVELTSRNDISISQWDSRFQPTYEDYHKYNRVYSQQSNLIIRKDVDYKFKKVKDFDTNIITSKVKVPGEIIDSWTDLLVNNVMSLKGEFGPINSLNSFKNELYTLQDSALAFISVLPRVQVSASDGAQVELGFGDILHEYRYISTDSGTKNKWSVVNSPNAFYYYDVVNKSINIFNGGVGGLTDAKGLHSYFVKNIINDRITPDNPILNVGVSTGYDYLNNDVFFTFAQNEKRFTLSYNEFAEAFTSFYDYTPSIYISRGSNFITTSPDKNKLYKQYAGNYNEFYGIKYPSYIILNVNPEPDIDCVFDNIQYKSEVYYLGTDVPDITLSKIQAYNEYQNSGLIPLTLGRNYNLRRKFRDWHALIPRQGRQRIRNPYIFLKLQFDNTNNYQLVLHPMNVYYTPNYTV